MTIITNIKSRNTTSNVFCIPLNANNVLDPFEFACKFRVVRQQILRNSTVNHHIRSLRERLAVRKPANDFCISELFDIHVNDSFLGVESHNVVEWSLTSHGLSLSSSFVKFFIMQGYHARYHYFQHRAMVITNID